MPKAYWIANITVNNPDRYPEYIETATPAYQEFGAKFLVRGGAVEDLEGNNRARNVVIEFESMEKALGCYNSPAYTKARAIRQEIADGDLIIVEGVDA